MKTFTFICAVSVLMFTQLATATPIFSGTEESQLITSYNLLSGFGKGQNSKVWQSSKGKTSSLIFDLGDVFNVASTEIFSFAFKNSSRNIQIESSVDGFKFNQVAKLKLAKASGVVIAKDILELNTIARYMKFDFQANKGSNNGLFSVNFFEQPAPAHVPEPASILLMLCGLLMCVITRSGMARSAQAATTMAA